MVRAKVHARIGAINMYSGSPPCVLFLCTANYFRSRFAHLYFNFLAHGDAGLHAESRGLMTHLHGLSGISRYALEGLQARNVPIARASRRNPVQVTAQDVAHAGCVIAMYRREHEPMVCRLFPTLAYRVEYWDIQDIDETTPEHTLARCQKQVELLLADLRQNPGRE